jgi:uncharacterized membrane protein
LDAGRRVRSGAKVGGAVNPFWSRSRIALTACAGASALAMLYVGLFQIRKLEGLACPLFGSGCESVALAGFAWPLGLADGLLGAAYCGILCALAQLRDKTAAAALVGLAYVWILLNLIGLAEMEKFGAFCFWCLFTAALCVPIASFAVKCAKQVQRSFAAGAEGPKPEAPRDQSA